MTPLITAILFAGAAGLALALAVRFIQRKAGGAFAAYVGERNQAALAALAEAGWRWDGDRSGIDGADFKPRGAYKGRTFQLALWTAEQAATLDVAAGGLAAGPELFLAPGKGAVGMVAALAYSERQQTHVATGDAAFDAAYFLSAAPPGLPAALLARHPELLERALRFSYLTVLLQHGQLLVQTNLPSQPDLPFADAAGAALEIAWALAETSRPATSPPEMRT